MQKTTVFINQLQGFIYPINGNKKTENRPVNRQVNIELQKKTISLYGKFFSSLKNKLKLIYKNPLQMLMLSRKK